MPPFIDINTYRKDVLLPVGKGYGMRPIGTAPTSIVIHTTSNDQPTTFETEARYLQKSVAVSAHYLNGKKRNQIAQILHPALLAWHAGASVAAWNNEHSIGIENHVSLGEQWTDEQHQNLTDLVKWLMTTYNIPAEMVETHRKIAVPGPMTTSDRSKWRKQDPASWSDFAFAAWRATLAPPPPPLVLPATRYRTRGIPVYQRRDCTGTIAIFLNEVTIDVRYPDGVGHEANGAGFVRLGELEAL